MDTVDLASKEFKMPGYTGYIPGVMETYKRTPVMAQVETKAPTPESFIYTREMVSPSNYPPARDPVNNLKPTGDILWPALLESAVLDSAKPIPNYMALGDNRIDVFRTSYNADFKAPFKAHERLRSPNRNEDLAQTTTSLRNIYQSAYNRVSEARLQKIIGTMRERLTAKMGNQNNNAFKFRKLFQMYDKDKTGRVHVEDFRNMAEQFGMQLDDDSLLALFHVYDPEGTGYLVYHDLAKHLMDDDCYSLYSNDVDVSANKAEEDIVLGQLASMQKKFAPSSADLEKVLEALDTESTGHLSTADLTAGCASLGLVLGEKEIQSIFTYCTPTAPGGHGGAVLDESGTVNYKNFIALLNAGTTGLTKRTRMARELAASRKGPPSLSVPNSARNPITGVQSPSSPAPKRIHN